MSTRRTFVSQTLLAAGAITLPFGCDKKKNSQSMKPKALSEIKPGPVALQLWTVREEIEKDLNGTLQKIREIGYSAIETAFFPDNVSIEMASQALQAADLKVCSIHIEKPTKEEQNRIIEMADAYGSNQIIWHGWPENENYKTT